MHLELLRLYNVIPTAAQSAVASVHGWQLRRWRYGRETGRLVDEALARESWSARESALWQEKELERTLHRAVTRVPYYRARWRERRRRGDRSSWEVLAHWEILDKEVVRRHPEAFVAEDCDRRRMFVDHTSGTTGTPLTVWLKRETVRSWYALYEARTRRWNGVSLGDRWGLLGGQPVVAATRKDPPFWVWNAGLNQLYLSAMHVAPWSVGAYLDAIRRYRLKFLVGYPSSLAYLALGAVEAGVRVPLEVVVTNAEPLYGYQREVIEQAFECPVRETYGLAEIVCMATECSAGCMHLWPEAGRVEILDAEGNPVPKGLPGRIVSTGLMNLDMPLIRYDTRDRGALAEDESTCRCGRSLPVLKQVWGRWDDVIVTSDGRRPVLLDRIFDPPVKVREGQIVQRTVDRFLIRVVPAEGWTERDAACLSGRLSGIVGEAQVTVETVERLPRTWAGKARILVSELAPASSTPDEPDRSGGEAVPEDVVPVSGRARAVRTGLESSPMGIEGQGGQESSTPEGPLAGAVEGGPGTTSSGVGSRSSRDLAPLVYRALPHPLKNVVASARGLQLRLWRYGVETEELARAARERESWDGERWASWRREQLGEVLGRAMARIPHYRRHWEGVSPGTRASALEDLTAWPILRKGPLRDDAQSFLDERSDPTGMWCEHTSGTTGTPLTLWQTPETVRRWYALCEARWRQWYGLSRRDRWAILGGQLVIPVSQRRPPFWVWNAAMRQLYMSSYHLQPEAAREYVRALEKHRVVYLWGYASALACLARFMREQGLHVGPLRAVISNAEPLYEHQREVIHQAFLCPVYDTYGMSEMVCAASECDVGSMHLWPEVGVYEVLEDHADSPVAPGHAGRLVCTGLLNREMPLIRYETGDRVVLESPETVCSCGRTLPILRRVEGRSDDLILTPSGRLVGRLDPVFKRDLPIVEAQIVQDAPDHLLIKVVPARGYSEATEREIDAALRDRVEGMRLTFERCESIPRSSNGKFKAVVSLIKAAGSSGAPEDKSGHGS